MNCQMRILAATLMLTSWCPVAAQSTGDKPSESVVNVKIVVSAEGKPSLPVNSKVQWEGVGDTCKDVPRGLQALHQTGETPLSLDTSLKACKVKLLIIVTGFNVQSVTVDLAGNQDKYEDPIRIMVKHDGPAELDWSHPSSSESQK
jgi:hypothetical protein